MKKGFTLLEVVIVIGIATIITAISLSAFSLFLGAEALDKDTETVVAVLREARGKTLSSQGGAQYGVHFTTTTVTLFSGTTYTAGAAGNSVAYLSGRTTISTSITGGSAVVFQKLTGKTSNSGTITVTRKTDTSKTKVVTVYATGLIERN